MLIVNILVVFGVILFSMVLHEMAHAYVAYFLGDTTAKSEGRLSPNPLVHIDPVMSVAVPLLLFMVGGTVFGAAKPVPINTKNLKWGVGGMVLVGIAGPLMNLVLAFASFLIGHFTGWLYVGGVVGLVFQELVLANLGFFAFNMIPIPPLDGSRVLYALAPDSVRDMMERIEHGAGIALVMIIVLFFGTYLSQFTYGVVHGILQLFLGIVGVA